MRLQNYMGIDEMSVGTLFMSELTKLRNLSWNNIKRKFNESWVRLKNIINSSDDTFKENFLGIINKHMKTNYDSLDDIKSIMGEETELNEDVAHWWQLIKQETFPALAFYPALQCWLLLDKMLKGEGFDAKIMLVYAIMWIFLMSGKYVISWNKWRKDNPVEYELEKKKGVEKLI